VPELASRQHEGVQQLLDLRVANLGVREHLTDEVYRPLNKQRVTFFCPLDYYGHADHLCCRSDIKQERFSCSRRDEYRRFGQCCLEPSDSFLSLEGPQKVF
jgi:hypothetical protein